MHGREQLRRADLELNVTTRVLRRPLTKLLIATAGAIGALVGVLVAWAVFSATGAASGLTVSVDGEDAGFSPILAPLPITVVSDTAL